MAFNKLNEKYRKVKSQIKAIEKEKEEKAENLISVQENLFYIRRNSLRTEETMKNYIKQGTVQIDYFKKQARKHKETSDRFKKRLIEAETIIEEQNKMISTFESIQASLDQ